MLARILDGETLRTTTKPDEIREAITGGKRVWIDLERQSPEADALLRDLQLHPADDRGHLGAAHARRRSTTSTTTST